MPLPLPLPLALSLSPPLPLAPAGARSVARIGPQRPCERACAAVRRWIKFEEDVEEAGERWSKPHVATLQLHVLHELRDLLRSDQTLLMLNLEEVNAIEQIAGAPRASAIGSSSWKAIPNSDWQLWDRVSRLCGRHHCPRFCRQLVAFGIGFEFFRT